jgi:hypothetical protein
MIGRSQNILYLSSSIAAALVATRIAISSLRAVIVFLFITLNLEFLVAAAAFVYGRNEILAGSMAIAAAVLAWLIYQAIRISMSEAELRAKLSLWAKEVGRLSGDLADEGEPSMQMTSEQREQIRVIQRFLELLSPVEKP